MKIEVDGKEIAVKTIDQEDYISLTDIAKGNSNMRPAQVIANWLRGRNTIEFIGIWEAMNNPDFKVFGFEYFKTNVGLNNFGVSVKDMQERANVIGIISTPGRYGGTYAHRHIAYNFAMWLEPAFHLYLITEFERLKAEEAKQLDKVWDERRLFAKINYGIQTEMINRNLVPRLEKGDKHFVFANEADLLNVAVFGMTAKEFREQFPKEKGNMRDVATIQQLTVLANLESINAHLIESGASQQARFNQLAKIAAYQLEILSEDRRLGE